MGGSCRGASCWAQCERYWWEGEVRRLRWTRKWCGGGDIYISPQNLTGEGVWDAQNSRGDRSAYFVSQLPMAQSI
jgi:hypothetical protein